MNEVVRSYALHKKRLFQYFETTFFKNIKFGYATANLTKSAASLNCTAL